MPTGPKGERRSDDVIGNAVKVSALRRVRKQTNGRTTARTPRRWR